MEGIVRGCVLTAVLAAAAIPAAPAWAAHGNGTPEVSPSLTSATVACAPYTHVVQLGAIHNETVTASGSFDGSDYTVTITPSESGGDKSFAFMVATTNGGPEVLARTVVASGGGEGHVYDYHHPTPTAGAGLAHDDGLSNPGSGHSDVTVCLEQVALSTLAAELRSFTASRAKRSIALRWRTASEVDVLGYNVYAERNGRRTKVNRRLIAAHGLWGGSYSFRYRVRRGTKAPSRFWLETIDLDGSRTWRSVRAR